MKCIAKIFLYIFVLCGVIANLHAEEPINLKQEASIQCIPINSVSDTNSVDTAKLSTSTPSATSCVPAKPSIPTATLTGLKIRVNWEHSLNAYSYAVQQSVNSGTWTHVVNTTKVFEEFNVTPGNSYRYRVSACNYSGGCSSYTYQSNTITVSYAPAVPTGLSASLSGSAINTNWNASSGATSYAIRQAVNGSWGSAVNTGTSRARTFSVAPGNYQYQVQACNASGCSNWSAATPAITIPPVPAVPTGLSANLAGLTVNTSWNASTHATYYIIHQAVNGAWGSAINTGTGRSRAFSVAVSNSYQYRVSACNSSGCSAVSASTPAIAVPPVPVAPAAPSASLSGSTISTSWGTSSGATSYAIRQAVNGSWGSEINTGTGRSYSFNASTGNSYQYQVKACNSSGCSGWSAASTAITFASQPVVQQFEWVPSTVQIGQPTTFYWNIENVQGCYGVTSTNPNDLRPGSGSVGPYEYTVPSTAVTKFYCLDMAGNRFPTDPDSFLEATRTVVASTSWAETSSGTPAELAEDSDEYTPTANNVGTLAADTGVNGGQASFQLNIPLPPGRAGMQPQVAISYNSQQGNGVLGVGFSLSAAGAISRCPATLAQDGFAAGVNYSLSNDRLCLDGARLIAVQGVYGQTGTIYRTELDQFTRVTQLGGNLNQPGTYFTAEYSSEQTAIFGSSGSAAKVIHFGRNETFSWLLNYQHDATVKNVVHYNYVAAGAGEIVLSTINYTGNSVSAQGNRQVSFDYEARPDIRSSYLAEGLSEQTVRLKTVTTRQGAAIVQQFKLQYVQSQASNRSLIYSITQCGYHNGSLVSCLKPSEFDWHDAGNMLALQPLNFGSGMAYPNVAELADILPRGDVNGDGVRDWPGRYVNAEGQSAGTHNIALKPCYKNFYLLKTPICTDADFNLDGLTDDWRINNGQLQIKYTGGQWFSTGIALDSSSKSGLLDSHLAHVADYNGDGWPDLMVHHHNAGQPTLVLYPHSKNINSPYKLTTAQTVFNYTVHESGARYSLQNDIQFMGDMTGNGRPDLIKVDTGAGRPIAYAQPVPVELLKNMPQTGSIVSFSSQPLSFGFVTLYDTFSYFIDLNSDGLPDWIGWTEETDRAGFGYRQNLGNGVFSDKTVITGASLAFRRDYYPLPGDELGLRFVPKYSGALKVHDINHDGIPELLVPGARLLQSCTNISTAYPAPTTSEKCGDELYGHFYQTNNRNSRTSLDSAALDDSIYQFDAIYFDTAADGTVTARRETTDMVGHAYESVIIDAYGTGLPGMLFNHRLRAGFSFSGSAAGTAFSGYENQYGVYINRSFGSGSGQNNSDYQPVDYLHAVTDAFDNRSEWRYRPLSSGESSAGQPFYETANNYQGGGYLHFASSMYAVQSFKKANGVGGVNETQFAYKGAMYHLQGRGFRGFRSIISQDISNGLITYSDFRQKFPFSGQLRGQFIFKASDIPPGSVFNIGYSGANATGVDKAVSAQIIDWQLNGEHAYALGSSSCTAVTDNVTDETDLTCPAGQVYSVYQAASDSYQYDLQSGQQYSHTRQSTDDIDAYNNVLTGTTTITDDSGEYESSFSATYAQNSSGWSPHRLTSRTEYSHPVQQLLPLLSYPSSLDSSSWVKTSYSNWHISGKPQQITQENSDNSRVSSVSTSYNDYGLPLSVTQTAPVMNSAGVWSEQSRIEQLVYSKDGTTDAADGYFAYKLTNALNHISYIHTDVSTGQPIRQTDANSIAVVTSYDAFGRPATVERDGQATQKLWYDTAAYDNNAPALAAWMQVIVQQGMPQQRIYFDTLGRELRKSIKGFSGDWVNQDTRYDSRGLVQSTTNPYIEGSAAGETHFSDYDELGRPGAKLLPGGLQVTYQYQNLTTHILADGRLNMSRSYNSLKQLMHTTDAKDGNTYYRYNGKGLPIVLQDANGVQLTASYNSLGQKLQVSDPNQGDSSYQYNGFGELEQETDANGLMIRFDYDQLGRQISRTSYAGNTVKDSAQFSFDTGLIGFPYQQSANGAVRTFGYDAVGNLTTNTVAIDSKSFTNQYFYDESSGLQKGMRYPNGLTLQYAYTPSGYLQEVSNLASGYVYRTINTQDAYGNMLDTSLGNGVFSDNQYDSETGWAQSLTAWRGSSRVHDVEYQQYDVFGNLEQVTNHLTGAQEHYIYDELHRLTDSTYSNMGYTVPISYSYDAVGNLLSKSDHANTYRYGNAARDLGGNAGSNAVRQIIKLNNSTVNFSYDNQGNLLSGDGLTISYNSFKQPTQISRGGNNFAFTYGANLERFKESRNGLITYEIDKLYEEESNGSWRLYLQDIAIIKYDSENGHQIRYTHKDRLGSTLTYTDHNGQVTDRRMFDAFGKPRAVDGNSLLPAKLQNVALSRNGFTDHRHLDEVELVHMNGRAYDYNLGRFLSVDPLIQAPGNSQSLNPYSYIMNNPLSGTDPTGYCSKEVGSKVCQSGVKIEISQDGEKANINLSGGTEKQQQAVAKEVVNTLSGGNGESPQSFVNGLANNSMTDLMGPINKASESSGIAAPLQGSPVKGMFKSIVKGMTFGIVYGDISSTPSLNADPQDSVDIEAYEESAGLSQYATSVLPGNAASKAVPLIRTAVMNATDLPLIKPGTQAWKDAVDYLSGLGKGKVNFRTSTANDAKALLKESRGNMNRYKNYTDTSYKKGYETHNVQNPRELDAGNNLQHLKWRDGKSGGHIYYDNAN